MKLKEMPNISNVKFYMYFDDFSNYITSNFHLQNWLKNSLHEKFWFSNGFQKLNIKIPKGFKAVYTMFVNVINVKHRCLKKKNHEWKQSTPNKCQRNSKYKPMWRVYPRISNYGKFECKAPKSITGLEKSQIPFAIKQ